MKTARDRALNVIASVDAVREQFAELGEPLTPRRLWRLLEAEHIKVLHERIRRPARARGFDGAFVISVRRNLAPREAWQWALHEYSHIKLGHFAEGEEIERQLSPCRRGDPREIEAKLFALLLVLGPDATPDTPRVAALVAKLRAPAFKQRIPTQLPLELPEKLPIYKELAQPFQHEREYESALVKRGAKRLRPKGQRIFRDTPTHDDERRIKWHDATKGTTRFEDIAGRHWWIYNFRKLPMGSTAAWESVKDFMDPTSTHRLFVNASGVRRLYRFENRREQRGYRVRHLDRQLAHARELPSRQTAVRALLTRSRPGSGSMNQSDSNQRSPIR